jgi:hypothetical protein
MYELTTIRRNLDHLQFFSSITVESDVIGWKGSLYLDRHSNLRLDRQFVSWNWLSTKTSNRFYISTVLKWTRITYPQFLSELELHIHSFYCLAKSSLQNLESSGPPRRVYVANILWLSIVWLKPSFFKPSKKTQPYRLKKSIQNWERKKSSEKLSNFTDKLIWKYIRYMRIRNLSNVKYAQKLPENC